MPWPWWSVGTAAALALMPFVYVVLSGRTVLPRHEFYLSAPVACVPHTPVASVWFLPRESVSRPLLVHTRSSADLSLGPLLPLPLRCSSIRGCPALIHNIPISVYRVSLSPIPFPPPACQLAAAAGVPVVMDAGGMEGPLSPDLLRHVSVFSPNETELHRLTGMPADTQADIERAAVALMQQVCHWQ